MDQSASQIETQTGNESLPLSVALARQCKKLRWLAFPAIRLATIESFDRYRH